MRTPLKNAKGMGSSNTGIQHWLGQRISAVILLPLTLWFVYSVVQFYGSDSATVQAWMSSPMTSALLVLYFLAAFYHAVLGLQVVIEDYVHSESYKVASILVLKFVFLLLAIAVVISIFRISL